MVRDARGARFSKAQRSMVEGSIGMISVINASGALEPQIQ
jgi:hypothetical protein